MLEVTVSIVAVYVAIVLLMELFAWRFQPSMEGEVTLFIKARDGAVIERKLYGHESDGELYVSSNHWFRSWYHAALKNPQIDVLRGDDRSNYRVTALSGEQCAAIEESYKMGFVLRLLCGFAPRKFLRLDPA